MSEHREQVESNRALWEGWTELHVASEFYDVEGFVSDPDSRPLDPLVLGTIGDVAGLRLLHLQCHFGLDTLRLARLGADATGVDFSSKAIAAARALSERTGIRARFVESDVRDLPDVVEEESFDVAFTSHGVISWLPELEGWARSISSRLRPGGAFHVVEMHPTLWMFDEEAEEVPLSLRYNYFGGDPLRWEEKGSYAAPDADFEGVSYSWQHTFEEILGALVSAGLAIDSLRDHDRIAWRYMPHMVEGDDGLWRLPDDSVQIPLMFSLTARKP